MSDRTDELWELVTSDFIDEQSRVIYARELATIAREAEARALKAEAQLEERIHINSTLLFVLGEAEAICEWLAGEVAMGRHDTVDNVLDAAREAVWDER